MDELGAVYKYEVHIEVCANRSEALDLGVVHGGFRLMAAMSNRC